MSEEAMTTPLPSRLRESAKALRGLSPCSEHSYELLDVVAWNIAAELAEAADALEAGRHSGGSEGLHETGFHAWAETQGFTGTEVHAAADAWLEAWNRAAPAAQVAQEGGGVSASAYLAKVEADPRRAAALQRARDRAADGVATDQPNGGE